MQEKWALGEEFLDYSYSIYTLSVGILVDLVDLVDYFLPQKMIKCLN